MVFPQCLNAQELNQPNMEFELMGGISYTTMRGDTKVEEGGEFKIGSVLGIGFDYYLNDRISLKSGLFYDSKNTNQDIEFYYFDESAQAIMIDHFRVERIFDYLTVPMMIRYQLKDNESKMNYFVKGGGYLSILLDQQTINYYGSTPNITYDELTDYKNTDLGVSLSIGCKFKISPNTFGIISLINNYGLKNINNIDTKSITKTNSTYLTVSLSKMIWR